MSSATRAERRISAAASPTFAAEREKYRLKEKEKELPKKQDFVRVKVLSMGEAGLLGLFLLLLLRSLCKPLCRVQVLEKVVSSKDIVKNR